MKLTLAAVSPRKGAARSGAAETIANDYLARASRYTPAEFEVFATEAALLTACSRDTSRRPARAAASLILFDSRGELATSDEFARTLGRLQDTGAQRVVLAIGPADGWSPTAFSAAHHTLSFGRITLPHELARVIAAEQIYRALSILAGHPYHLGH